MKWMKSYLNNRKQMVVVSGKMSTFQEMNIGTPQGSRLSPLLFIILMADMDLWAGNSILSNFADDTQSIHISDKTESLLETTRLEANSIIKFFECNNLVNNADKAALLYNGKRKEKPITIENIGGENLVSTYSEKLLGLHINSDFKWSTHIDKISIELKKRIGLLRRIRNRVPKNKIVTISEAIFNSIIRYGCAVYLNPVYEEEEIKVRKLPKPTATLQILQNKMIRVILGLKKDINIMNVRNKIEMMSVNQMCVYHTVLEAYNIMKNSSSEKIQMKWSDTHEIKYSLRRITNNDLKIPEKTTTKCFSYTAAKQYNMLPKNLRENSNPKTFKTLTKKWIWEKIPSY